MTFREAFFVACEQNPAACKGKTALIAKARLADPRRAGVRLLWRRAEKKSVRQYERETGKKVASFGDGQFLDWLVNNLPKILQIITAILAMFG